MPYESANFFFSPIPDTIYTRLSTQCNFRLDASLEMTDIYTVHMYFMMFVIFKLFRVVSLIPWGPTVVNIS